MRHNTPFRELGYALAFNSLLLAMYVVEPPHPFATWSDQQARKLPEFDERRCTSRCRRVEMCSTARCHYC